VFETADAFLSRELHALIGDCEPDGLVGNNAMIDKAK